LVNNKDTYSNWLSNPNELDVKETDSLKELINLYPFCSTSRVLYLKGLQNTNSIHYNQVLKETAAYAGDRQRLFYLLTGSLNEEEKLEMIDKAARVVLDHYLDNAIEAELHHL
jgi:hypothetical protein